MIIKRRFHPLKVLPYVQGELLLALVTALLAFSLHRWEPLVALPFSIAATLGGALAIFIGFRNNSAYGRWWEARTLWGGIVNSTRVLARLIITFTDSHAHQPHFDRARSEAFKREMVWKVIAWAHALRFHLRGQSDWSVVAALMPAEERAAVDAAANKPNVVMQLIGQRIYRAMADGTLGGFDSFQMEGQLLALANHQGGCERIKNTPLLRQYHFFTRLFLQVFIVLLPFCLVADLDRMGIGWVVVPVALVISFVFAIIGKVGEVNEDPFEGRITDVPLNALCNTIERDLRELLGEAELPAKRQPVDGYLD
ncbi:MAG TPA: bestrophin family ion channel [Flavobacteriales bacterium]|nr:bestrophin family ion channel [Flavobacteriales bacterium]HMR28163.1 bestrophin family ion channel [Flavobacteriales bacterium]